MSRVLPLCLAVILLAAACCAAGPLPPTNLRVEYLSNPMGVDVAQPRFSWFLEHSERGQKQTGYQVLVSTRPETASGDLWDSGKVEAEDSTQVVYGGKPLVSGQTCYWKVRYWDKDGAPSTYSAVASFDTGLFNPEDWKGTWIGGFNQLRKEFRLAGRPVRARAYISGIGYYELRVNGYKVGAAVLDPGWTTYTKRVLYSTYDITPLLRTGSNAVAVMLGQGWYGSRALMAQINVEMEGGRRASLASDLTWKGKPGPITADSVYHGETYDARLEMPGWDRPDYDEAGWAPATAAPPPQGALSAQLMPPIQVVDTIVPLKRWSPKPGVYVYDMGQNMSGWAQLRVSGPAGARVRLRFAELIYGDGSINIENLRAARATDIYILKGEGREVYEPRFTYHGFRYVEVSGLPEAPGEDTIRGRVVHTAVRTIGGFASSNPVLNQLQRIIYWGQKTNLHSVPTDCDQRDERMGWMGDAQATAEEAMQNFDMAAFYTTFLRNIRDVQDEEGRITDTVPHKGGRRPADPAWGAAYPLITWYMYERYGDRRVLEAHYDGIKKWVDYQRTRAEDGLLSYSYYGDWVPVQKTTGSYVSAFYYLYGHEIVSRVAAVLGKKEDAEAYSNYAAEIRTLINKKYFDPATNNYANGTQTANTLALFLDIVPKDRRSAVAGNLRDDIVYTHDTHITTGFIGIKYLMDVMARQQPDLAYELAAQTTYPSWGYMIENGATTLWELWQNKTGPSMNSHNHPMFGSVGAYLYQYLGGIQPDNSGVGYRKLRIAPQMVRDLRWVDASIETLRGTVVSNWTRTDFEVALEVSIPVGSEAEVRIPKPRDVATALVREGDQVVWKGGQFQPAPGVTAAREAGNTVILQVGSGRYRFTLSEEQP
jgi:alpha-L-rhamnosidase